MGEQVGNQQSRVVLYEKFDRLKDLPIQFGPITFHLLVVGGVVALIFEGEAAQARVVPLVEHEVS